MAFLGALFGHLAHVWWPVPPTFLDGCVLQRHGTDGDPVGSRQDE